MIFFLILFSIIFAPGNLIPFLSLLIFFIPTKKFHVEHHHKFFIAYMVWMFLCSLCSYHPLESFFGSLLRMEGWFMWLIMARLAWVYWEKYNCLEVFMASLLLILVILNIFPLITGECPLREAAMGSIAAMSMVGFLGWCSIFMLPVIPLVIYSHSRACLVAMVVSALIYPAMKRKVSIHGVLGVMALMIVSLFFSPYFIQKLENINISAMGMGARTNWILQAEKISKPHPFMGAGPEVIGRVLKNPESGPQTPKYIPDRTHNVMYDIILQTGWVGYILALLTFGAAVGCVIKNASHHNIVCLSMVVAWIVFGFLNPQGVGAHALMVIALFGIRRDDWKSEIG